MNELFKIILLILFIFDFFIFLIMVFEDTIKRIKMINVMNKEESNRDNQTLKFKCKDLFYKTLEIKQNYPLNDGYFEPNNSAIENIKNCYRELKFKKIIIGTNDTVSYLL